MSWNSLSSLQEWEQILQESRERPVLVFKHSTRCSISRMALDRFDRDWEKLGGEPAGKYYLDLLNHRDVSNRIAEDTGVEHQSPQVLLLQYGKCVYSETHQAIRVADLLGHLPAAGPQ